MTINWYEVWTDEGIDIPYVLILIAKDDEIFQVCDPKEDNNICFQSKNYEDAKLWLLEDEYTLVEGRMDSH